MSFPIYKYDTSDDFFNVFKDRLDTFSSTYILPELLGKNIVLQKNYTRRKLTDEEIKRFTDIYLLPKLYIFYSKLSINYNFNSN